MATKKTSKKITKKTTKASSTGTVEYMKNGGKCYRNKTNGQFKKVTDTHKQNDMFNLPTSMKEFKKMRRNPYF